MQLFMIEGTIQSIENIDDNIMQEHMAYTQKAIQDGAYFISGLKADQSGGIFIMKAKTQSEIEAYFSQEPFYRYGIQTYRITAFDVHYHALCMDWINL